MYNGIGLNTPRGSGTNGYVQRNLSHVPVKRDRVEYVKDVELKKLEKLIEKKGNAEILEHERKRKIEVKCMEMREMMLSTGYDEKVTNEKVQKFRNMLIERESFNEKGDIDYDDFGRPIAKETHQIAQASDERNRKFREAFGIGEFNKREAEKKKAEETKEIEKKKAELANKKYDIVLDEPKPENPREPPKDKSRDIEDQEEKHEERQSKKSSKHSEKSKDKEDRHHRDRDDHRESRDEKKRKSSPSNHKEKSTQKHSKKHRREQSDDDEREEKSRRHHRHRDRSTSRH